MLKQHKKYQMSFKGFVTSCYGNIKSRTKIKNQPKLLFTKEELRFWILQQESFNSLWENWLLTELKDDKPSIDRIDNTKGYYFSNMQIVSWKENNFKGRGEWSKPVRQWYEGSIVAEYKSAAEASKATGFSKSGIGNKCKDGGILFGFTFEYIEEE